MKIELIQPLHADYGALGKRESFVFKPAQLTMPYLAALTPEDIEISISDEMIGPLNLENDADLVGITFVTPFAHRAYELGTIYRSQGKKVVFGGPHASLVPEEAKEYSDAVVVGEAEDTWPLLIEDFKQKKLKPFYRSAAPDLKSIPFARRSLLRRKHYIVPDVIQASRGCPFRCDFCTLGAIYGYGHRLRPVEEVIREIETFEGDTFIFWDDNIVGTPSYAKELFRRLIPYKKKWLGQGSITITRDRELLSLASMSGCIGLFVGIESVSQDSLETVNKGFNKVSSLKDEIKKFHDAGIAVLAGMIFGFDADDGSVFERTLEVAIKAAIDGISFSILTPYPGTKLFKKLQSEGRILHRDWSKYNSEHVVFMPKKMSPDELQRGHNRANRQFYSIPSIVRRLLKSRTKLGLTVRLNMADRKYSYNRFKSEL
ncbi:MAG: radical SAM protein [Thermodesulfovibrionales bacterium]